MDGDSNLPALAEPQLLQVQTIDHGLWNVAAFEQTERVATIMADSGLMPKALTHIKQKGQGDRDTEVQLPDKVIFARAVLISNQARHLDVDPVLFAQSCSIVHGRLMYEGKLVDAMIEMRLRWKLDYDFGLWNTDHFEPVASDDALWGVAERLAVRVTAKDRDGKPVLGLSGKPLSIEGSVGMWKTTGNSSPWGSPANWRRQLRYRGAREWARAHASGIMVGIVAVDEAEELEYQGEATAIIREGASTPQLLHDGFDDRKPDPPPKETREEKRRRQIAEADARNKNKNAGKAAELDKALGGDDLPAGLKEGSSLSAASNEGEKTDVAEGGAVGNGPTETDGAQDAASEQASSETATDASGDGAAGTSDSAADGFPAEFTSFIDSVEAAKQWLEVKQAMAAFYNTAYFKGLPPEQQNKIRANTWDQAFENKVEGLPDHALDVSAFRLWIEWEESPGAILDTLVTLERQEAFASKDDAFKDGIRRAVNGRLERLHAK